MMKKNGKRAANPGFFSPPPVLIIPGPPVLIRSVARIDDLQRDYDALRRDLKVLAGCELGEKSNLYRRISVIIDELSHQNDENNDYLNLLLDVISDGTTHDIDGTVENIEEYIIRKKSSPISVSSEYTTEDELGKSDELSNNTF